MNNNSLLGDEKKGEGDRLQISRGVYEGCLLVAPNTWVSPEYPPTQSSNEYEEMVSGDVSFEYASDSVTAEEMGSIGGELLRK